MRGFSLRLRAFFGLLIFFGVQALVFKIAPVFIPEKPLYHAFAFSGVFGFILLFLYVRSVRKGIEEISETVMEAGQDNSYVLPRVKGNDETAQLHRDVNRLITSMRTLENRLDSVKEGTRVSTRLKERRITELEILYDISRDLKNVYDFNGALSICLDKVVEALCVDWACFLIYYTNDSSFSMEHVRGSSFETVLEIKTGIIKNNVYSAEKTLSSQVIKKDDTFFSHECARDTRFKDFREFSELSGPVNNFIAVPVKNRDNKPIGVLMGVNKDDGLTFNASDSGFMKELARLVYLSYEKVTDFEKGFHDSATGLYVHEYFLQRLREEALLVQRSARGRETSSDSNENNDSTAKRDFSVAVFSPDNIDFDGPLAVADPDKVLKELAEGIRRITRIIDIPVCLGEKTFGLILPDTDLNGALVFSSRLKDYFENNSIHLKASGQNIKPEFSTGLASYSTSGLDGQEAEAIVKQARNAMDTARKAGGNRALCHTPENEAK
jgi:diguanylate cyclase (GGDEF)-like protein